MWIDLFVALRFLRDGRVQTLLLVLGATTGVTVVFFVTALITAVESTMVAQTLDVLAHVVIRRPESVPRPPPSGDRIAFDEIHPAPERERALRGWPPLLQRIRRLPGVRAASPAATGPALALQGRAARSVVVVGIRPADFAQVIAIEPRMRRGRFDVSGDHAVIGIDLADDLGLRVGHRFRLVATDAQQETFVVAGLFDMGSAEANQRWVLTSLRKGQTLLDMPAGLSTIELRLHNIWAADTLARQLSRLYPVTAESWMQNNTALMVAIQSQRGATVIIRVFIMVAVAMAIASVLVMAVVQKSRQVGILRAMGMARRRIVIVFLLQGGLIGLLGAGFGCALGTLLARLSEAWTTTPDGAPMYPIQLDPALYVICTAIAVGTAVLAAALPAARAANLRPTEAIRYG